MAEFTEVQLPWHPDQYSLLDFGGGRKLERFGRYILDRPCAAACGTQPKLPHVWDMADWKLQDGFQSEFEDIWSIDFDLPLSSGPQNGMLGRGDHLARTIQLENQPRIDRLSFQLRLTPFGHVGLFPEQAENWHWLYEQVQLWDRASPNCLNLFAYTGAATLMMAAAGATVVHIDSSAPSVHWARRNAELSGVQDRPIRWIVEDAFKFISREIRRGNRYQLIVLDPPAYGHAPNGKAWKLEDTWPILIEGCLELLAKNRPTGLLWTGHSPIPTIDQIHQKIFADRRFNWEIQSGFTDLLTNDGRRLNQGYFVRAVRK